MRIIHGQRIVSVLIVGFEERPNGRGAIQHRAASAVGIFVPDGSPHVKSVVRGDPVVNSEYMLKVGNFEEPEGFIVPRSVVGHVGQRIHVQKRLPVTVDAVGQDHIVKERLACNGVVGFDRGLRKVADPFQRRRLVVTRDAGLAYSQSTSGIGNPAQSLVEGVKEEQLVAGGIDFGNCNGAAQRGSHGVKAIEGRL